MNLDQDTLINTTTDGRQDESWIAALADGSFIIGWTSSGQDGSGNGIFAQHFSAHGTALGEEFRVNTTTDGDQYDAAITALDDGGFVITWNTADDGNSLSIYAQRYNAAGVAQGDEFRINTTTAGDQNSPAITTLTNGNFVVSWDSFGQDNEDSLGVYAQRFDASGNPIDSEFPVNTETVDNQYGSSIMALTGGGYVISWTSLDGEENGIYAQRYAADGSALGTEFRVNSTTAGNQYYPVSTTLDNGGFVIAWTHQISTDTSSIVSVKAQRYDAEGQPIGGEIQLNTTSSIGPINPHPALIALDDGSFMASYNVLQANGKGFDIYAQRFDANGITSGSEFRVNADNTENHQFGSSMAVLADGGLIVNWASKDVIDNDYGIYARAFHANDNPSSWKSVDCVFDWAEHLFPDTLPDHPDSQNILGYHARLYDNGYALGEMDDQIFFYTGNSLILVGAVDTFLPAAIVAGF